jgi:hypothetical protein
MKPKPSWNAALLLAALLAVPVAVHAQDAVNTNRMTELRASPDDAARLIRTLADKTPVQTLQRRGPWTQVKAGNDTGWVRMMHLRGGATVVEGERSTGSGFLSGFQRLLAGESRGSTRAQGATLGIRGITEEDLRNAEVDVAAFNRMKGLAVADGEARRFALQAKLSMRSVAYLAQDAIDAQKSAGVKK